MLYQGSVIDVKSKLTGDVSLWTDLEANDIIAGLISFALVAAVVVCFFLLVLGGIKWITAGEDKEAMSGAQKTLTAAVVGLVIVFSAWGVLNLLQIFFGLESLTFFTIGGGD